LETTGLLFTWNENAHVLPGPENVVVGVEAEKVPLSLYKIVPA
jgi:hypothetical protein